MSRAGPPRCLLRLPPRKAEPGRVCRALFLRYGHTDRWAHPDGQTTDKCNGHVHASSRAPPPPRHGAGGPPLPGDPRLPSPCLGTQELGGGTHRLSPGDMGRGTRGLCADPALQPPQSCPPVSCPSPQHVPIPSSAGPRGGGTVPASGGSPTAWASPQCCGGALHPCHSAEPPLQHTRGGGQHAVPPRQAPSSTTPTGPDPSTARNGVGTDPTLPVGVLGGGGGGHMQGRRSPEATTARRVPGAICPS